MAVPQAAEEQVAAYVPDDVCSPIKVAVGSDMITSGLSFGDPLAPVGPPHGPGTLRELRQTGPRLTTPEGRAVAAALRWLAAHQLPDGGWSFHHALAPGCRGKCRNQGDLDEARIAATGLALLPFLAPARRRSTAATGRPFSVASTSCAAA